MACWARLQTLLRFLFMAQAVLVEEDHYTIRCYDSNAADDKQNDVSERPSHSCERMKNRRKQIIDLSCSTAGNGNSCCCIAGV